MSKQPIQTAILAASAIGAALLSIAALSFSAPTGELSKLVYNGNYWCVSNWIEEEDSAGNKVKLPDPDGRNAKDHRLEGRLDWLRLDQVEADTKEEAEQKATRKGLFEPSEKVELRQKLDAGDKAFFTSHFNTGATHPGPCVGSGMGTGIVGKWINDAIREDCFDIKISGDRQAVYNPDAFSAAQIDAYIAKNKPDSPLKGMGTAFVAAAQKHGVNAGVLLGITNAESSLGLQCKTSKTPAPKGLGGSKNAFGLTTSGQGTFITFSSYEEGIDRAAANLASSKYKNLQSLREIRLKWCGYETESESSGIKLSDGSTITYACKNKGSNWEQEVMVVVNEMAAQNPSPAQNDTSSTQPKKISSNPNCPDNPPVAGPASGQDHRVEIAQAFEKALKDAYSDEAASDLGDENYENNEDLGSVNNAIAKTALTEVGYQGSGPCRDGKRDRTKYYNNGKGCVQWCAAFVTWTIRKAGYNIPSMTSSRSVLAWYKNNRHATFTDPAKAGEGDIVVWKRGEKTGHIGIVVANDGGRLRIVEGNTSNDMVKANWYSYSRVRSNIKGLLGFGRW